MILSKVVFPEPLGPRIATSSLSRRFKLTSLRAVCTKSPVMYFLWIFSIWSIFILPLCFLVIIFYNAFINWMLILGIYLCFFSNTFKFSLNLLKYNNLDIDKQHIALIILDVMMPKMDGYEFTMNLQSIYVTVRII